MDYNEVRSIALLLDMIAKAVIAIACIVLASNVRIMIHIRRKKDDK